MEQSQNRNNNNAVDDDLLTATMAGLNVQGIKKFDCENIK
jgi:hypothetical protein